MAFRRGGRATRGAFDIQHGLARRLSFFFVRFLFGLIICRLALEMFEDGKEDGIPVRI